MEAKAFGEFGEKWLTAAPMADSTRAMRRSIFERELLPPWRKRLLSEIAPDDLRKHCAAIVERGAPAILRARDVNAGRRGDHFDGQGRSVADASARGQRAVRPLPFRRV